MEQKLDEEFKRFDVVTKKGKLVRNEVHNVLYDMMRRVHQYPSYDEADV